MNIGKQIIWYFLVACAVISALFLFYPDTQSIFVQSVYVLVTCIPVVFGYMVFREYGLNHSNGKVLFLLFLGMASWSFAEVLWYVFGFFLNIDPYPSIADLFFFVPYPIFTIAILIARKSVGVRLPKGNHLLWLFDGVIVTVLTAMVVYFGIFKAYSTDVGLLENTLSISYGVADLILVVASLFAVTLMREYKKGKFGFFWSVITLGFFAFLVADVLFAMFGSEYDQGLKPYVYIDLIWLFGYLSIGYGFLDNYLFMKRVKNSAKIS